MYKIVKLIYHERQIRTILRDHFFTCQTDNNQKISNAFGNRRNEYLQTFQECKLVINLVLPMKIKNVHSLASNSTPRYTCTCR